MSDEQIVTRGRRQVELVHKLLEFYDVADLAEETGLPVNSIIGLNSAHLAGPGEKAGEPNGQRPTSAALAASLAASRRRIAPDEEGLTRTTDPSEQGKRYVAGRRGRLQHKRGRPVKAEIAGSKPVTRARAR